MSEPTAAPAAANAQAAQAAQAAPAAPAATAPAGDAAQRRLLRNIDHLRALMQQTPATLAGYLAGMLLIAAIYGTLAPPLLLLAWLAAAATLWTLRLLHYLRYRRRPDADMATLRAWRRSWHGLVVLQASLWGTAAWLFWSWGTPYHQLGLIFIVYSYCLASVQLLAAQPPMFFAFMSLVLVPMLVRIASDSSQPWHWQLTGLLAVLFGLTVLMGRTYGSALGQAIALKARTDELAGQLRVEMSAADTAKRAAEAASRAKTQFFAAASHDLRQPLHAMGLFAEALRQRSRDPEVAALVNSINESVDALEGLFGELLDITRIDTGGVDVNSGPVRLREMFARLRLQFEPIAFEKGLMLSFRGDAHVAQALQLLLGTLALFVLAGFIEGTISQIHPPRLSVAFKVTFALLVGGGVYAYLWSGVPRRMLSQSAASGA